MGRQTRIHMLPDDCRRLVEFLRERDLVIVSEWHSDSTPEIEECNRPWETGGMYCLWNQRILPELRRQTSGAYFNVSFAAPVIELSYPSPLVEPWNGQAALVQGRIWASFQNENRAFRSWYDATVRWIRKNFVRDQALGLDRDSVGPAAYEWFRNGGLLLPGFRPPVTDAWLGWTSIQNEHRNELKAQLPKESSLTNKQLASLKRSLP